MSIILRKKEQGIGLLQLNRPEVFHAINFELMDELEKALDEWKTDDEVKVLLIMGTGEKAFASGGDIKEFHRLRTAEEAFTMLGRMGGILRKIERFGKPTIAAVNGFALGGGSELALACDIRIASERAVFGFIQISLAITTGWGGGMRLLQLLPRGQALDLLLTGDKITAQEAWRIGLVSRILSAEEFTKQAIDYARRMANYALPVLQSYVKLANGVSDGKNRDQLAEEEMLRCSELWAQEAHLHAVERFMKK